MASQRDRRDDGRPENARPRDRTGRPLPYDTEETALLEEFEHDTVEEALATGAWLWDQQRFFEAHESLETVWHAAPDGDRDFWQGVIQVAVAGVHAQRGNPTGAGALLERALQRLEPCPSPHRGVDVDALCAHARRVIAQVDAGEPPALPGPFPAVDGGAWFALTEDADGPPEAPTPVPDEPAWRAGERRRPRTPPTRDQASKLST